MKLIVKPQKDGLDFFCDTMNLTSYFQVYFDNIIISKKKITVQGIFSQNDIAEFIEHIKEEVLNA